MDALDASVRLFSYALVAIGTYALVLWIYETFRSPVGIIWGLYKRWTVGEHLARRYGQWAVITGGSDGIGRQCSLFLASKGFNIIIIAMPDEKLDRTVREIQAQFKVHVTAISVDFSSGYDLNDQLKKKIGNLDIGVLVNNVGTVTSTKGAYFDTSPIEHQRLLINVNINAAVMLTHIVVPGMKQRGRGLIVNVSSEFGLTPVPRLLMYGATKAFMYSFSEALRHELQPFGVDCQTVTPGLVATTLTKDFISASVLARLIDVDVNSYGSFFTMTFGKSVRTTGHWRHAIQQTFMKLLPPEVRSLMFSKGV